MISNLSAIFLAAWGLLSTPTAHSQGVLDNTLVGEIVFAFDSSTSVAAGAQAMDNAVNTLMTQLETNMPGTMIGLSSFQDKPTAPLGVVRDVCTDLNLPLSNAAAIAGGSNRISTGDGGDAKMSQLDALYYTAKDSNVGWTNSATKGGKKVLRTLVLVTGTQYHTAGEAAAAVDAGTFPAVDPASYTDSLDCTTRDYPSVAQVKAALEAQKISLLILVSPNGGVPTLKTEYETLLSNLGVSGAVEDVAANGSDFVAQVTAGLQSIAAATTTTTAPTTAAPTTAAPTTAAPTTAAPAPGDRTTPGSTTIAEVTSAAGKTFASVAVGTVSTLFVAIAAGGLF